MFSEGSSSLVSWGHTNSGNERTATLLEESSSERHRWATVPRRPLAGGRSMEAESRASWEWSPVDGLSGLEPGRERDQP